MAGSEVHTGPQRVQFTWDGSCTLDCGFVLRARRCLLILQMSIPQVLAFWLLLLWGYMEFGVRTSGWRNPRSFQDPGGKTTHHSTKMTMASIVLLLQRWGKDNYGKSRGAWARNGQCSTLSPLVLQSQQGRSCAEEILTLPTPTLGETWFVGVKAVKCDHPGTWCHRPGRQELRPDIQLCYWTAACVWAVLLLR